MNKTREIDTRLFKERNKRIFYSVNHEDDALPCDINNPQINL